MKTNQDLLDLTTQQINIAEGNTQKQLALMMIDPRLIKVDLSVNNRETYELESLKDYIKENGVEFDPIIVYKIDKDPNYKYGLLQGFRRTLSCLELINEGIDIKLIPSVFKPKPNNETIVLMNLTSNNGSPLTIMETAKAYQKLINFGWTATDIAVKVGVSNASVCQMLTIANAPKVLQNAINEERIAPTLARKLIDEHGDDKASEIVANLIIQLDNEIANVENLGTVETVETTVRNLENQLQLSLFSEHDTSSIEVARGEDVKTLENDLGISELSDLSEEKSEKKPEPKVNGLKVRDPKNNIIVKKNSKGKKKITDTILKESGLLKGSSSDICNRLKGMAESSGLLPNIGDVVAIIELYENNKKEPSKLFNLLVERFTPVTA